MNKDAIRFWLHFPVGCLCAWLTFNHVALGISLTAWFALYEIMNDWRKVDHSYKDIYGAVFGFGIVATMLVVYQLIG